MSEKKPEQTPREIIDKLSKMTPEEFNQFMRWHFEQICKRPLSSERRE
jgi:hypothetical protein